MPPAVPMQHQSRRHQEYHQYQQHMPPRSPGSHNPYAQYYPPPYYQHPNQMPYPLQRWPSHQSYAPYPMHPPHVQYPPRSPMVVSSQPHPQSTAPPSTRPPPFSHVPFTPQSPHPAAPPTPAASIPQSLPSPHEPPSKSSTPQPISRRSSVVTQPPPQPQTRMPFYPGVSQAYHVHLWRLTDVSSCLVSFPRTLETPSLQKPPSEENKNRRYVWPMTQSRCLQDQPGT